MNIVVDTSVLIAVIAGEPERDALVRLTSGADLIAPYSVHWEIGNALSAMLKRKRITLVQAATVLKVYREIPIRFLDVDLELSLRIADELGIYAYDAYLIECAARHQSPLLSLDRNLINAARQVQVKVMEVS